MPIDPGDIQIRLEPLIFRLDIPVGDGCYGTGFFIGKGFAITAFHNLHPSVLDDPSVRLDATFRGQSIEFVWELCSEKERKWQSLYDVAVLRTVTPVDEPKETFLYLDPNWKGRSRDSKWISRNLVAVGFPSGSDQVAPIQGITRIAHPLVDAPRVVGAKTEGTTPAALFFSGDPKDLALAYGMSGSPVFDEDRCGVIGVLVGVQGGFYATELAHIVNNWPAGRPFFEDFEPRSTVVAEETAVAKLSWRLALGILAMVALAVVFWFRSYLFAPRHLEVELMRDGASQTETVKDQISAQEGQKLRLLITSPADGYLYVVDREFTRNGALRQPYLTFPTLTTGAGRNKVTRGMVVSYPDPSDVLTRIEAKPLHPPDPDYAGEALTILVYGSQLPIDRLEAEPIPLTPEQFPDDGERLLVPSPAAPKALKKIELVVRRVSQTTQPRMKSQQ